MCLDRWMEMMTCEMVLRSSGGWGVESKGPVVRAREWVGVVAMVRRLRGGAWAMAHRESVDPEM